MVTQRRSESQGMEQEQSGNGEGTDPATAAIPGEWLAPSASSRWVPKPAPEEPLAACHQHRISSVCPTGAQI